MPRSRSAVAGAGTGKRPWAQATVPPPTLIGEATHWSAPSAWMPARDGDDVDDGVDGADLVEVDLLDGDVVDAGLGGAEQLEGADGGVLDRRGERGVLDELADDGQRAAMHVVCA